MEAPERVVFTAALPGTLSAMLLDGSGDGGQIKLNIPRTDVGALVLLHQFFAGKVLRVTVELDDSGADEKKPRYERSRTK